ncbi:sarcosine oxidase subunit gamma [uncultured Thioclava sp.]|uniref:sarcosine oxidase subunit gamma n=1 Tax=uncultured Thioclava sp. TaxID=473858 RepID=UPI0025E7A812|nr:sarcosine oxidase subunit gamma family protein [uncultured Thioclava sp.]
MSDAVSALQGATHEGFVTVAEAGLVGMLSIRCDLTSKTLLKALKAHGFPKPEPRQIVEAESGALAWMSPDELLLICDHAQAAQLARTLSEALEKTHALIGNVSDARALFRIQGAKSDQVIMKLCPADIAALPTGEMRRTRLAQVPAAFWRSGPNEISLICFRSVASYVMGLLEISARPGSELFETASPSS